MDGNFTVSDIFHSSDNPVRMIQYGNIEQLLKDKVINVDIKGIGRGYYITWLHRLITNDDLYLSGSDIHTRNAKELMSAMDAGYFDVGGGKAHKVLAHYAAAFLVDNGMKPEFEINCGKRVDVMSACGKWIIECGDTDGFPVYDHLLLRCQTFAVMPFYYSDDFPFMFIFMRGDKWDSYKQYSYKLNGFD